MDYLYAAYFFIIGTIFGSFYNVVGYRLPRGESLVKPRSHCPNCNHDLTPIELIPIFSFLFQRGKCKKCKQKISWFYTIFELLTGILFAMSYLIFNFSIELLIALSFVSMSVIIIISDYQTLTIPDEVLVFFGILFIIFNYLNGGIDNAINFIIDGFIAFIIMFAIKKIADFCFKKESMGGGDIKLMFVFGLVLGYEMAVLSIFLGSVIGLPISLLFLKYKNTNIVPFGPFLCVGALIILLSQIDISIINNLLI